MNAEAQQKILLHELNHRVKNNMQMLQALLQISQRDTQNEDARAVLAEAEKEIGEKAERKELVHYAGDSLIPIEADRGMYLPHAFVGDDGQGHALYLHVGRAVRRVDA